MNIMKIVDMESILEFLDKSNTSYEFSGSKEDQVAGFSSVTSYKENTITWIKNEEKLIELAPSSYLHFLVHNNYFQQTSLSHHS